MSQERMVEQQTIEKPTRLSGVGLHTGQPVQIELVPSEPGTGIVFCRVDLPGAPRVEARAENLVFRPRRSALAKGPAEVQTTEHLLAVLSAVRVHNLLVRLDGPELPGFDGSAATFYEAVRAAGTVRQGVLAPEIRLEQPVALSDRGGSVVAMKRDGGLSIGYTLDYSGFRRQAVPDCPLTQFLELEITEEVFARELAPARTFVFEEEVAQLRAEGLGKGASVENTLVVGQDGIVGNKLRFRDEFVRHKILDLLGDLYLTGSALQARILATKSGHGLNVQLARRLLELSGGQAPGNGGSGSPGEPRGQPPAGAVPRESPAPVEVATGTAEAAAQEGRSPADRSPGARMGGAAPPAPPPGSPHAPRTGADGAAPAAPYRDIREIQKLLPHRYPFLLVDRILELEPDRRAVGLKNVTFNEEFFQGHFPGRPVMPGVLIVEAMAQLAGALVLQKDDRVHRLAYLLSLDRVKFRRTVEPGDQLVLAVEVRRRKERIAAVEARATVGGTVVAEAEICFMLIEN